MSLLSRYICTCGHVRDIHEEQRPYVCSVSEHCHCRGWHKDVKDSVTRKVILSVAISVDADVRFRKFVGLNHGHKKGALSFEVERALRQYMGEKNLDILLNDREWMELNR